MNCHLCSYFIIFFVGSCVPYRRQWEISKSIPFVLSGTMEIVQNHLTAKAEKNAEQETEHLFYIVPKPSLMPLIGATWFPSSLQPTQPIHLRTNHIGYSKSKTYRCSKSLERIKFDERVNAGQPKVRNKNRNHFPWCTRDRWYSVRCPFFPPFAYDIRTDLMEIEFSSIFFGCFSMISSRWWKFGDAKMTHRASVVLKWSTEYSVKFCVVWVLK